MSIDNHEEFYTDANSYRMMKRWKEPVKIYRIYPEKESIAVSSYFYPVGSAIMIEDPLTKEQMILINDKPQSGSAYKKGRIELMISRFGKTQDELGVDEPMEDKDINQNGGVNVSATFYLRFGKSEKHELYRAMIERHEENMALPLIL